MHLVGFPLWLPALMQLFEVVFLLPSQAKEAYSLWTSARFKSFVQTSLNNEPEDKEGFQDKFVEILNTHTFNGHSIGGMWCVAFFVVPIVGLRVILPLISDELSMFEHIMFLWIIPEAVRNRFHVSLSAPLEVAKGASKFRTQRMIWQIEAASTEGKAATPGCWQDLCAKHIEFDEDLSDLWKFAQKALALDILSSCFYAGAFGVVAVVAHSRAGDVTCLCICTVVLLLVILNLQELAAITESCQSLSPGCNSIRKAASMYVKVKMNTDTVQQYMKFTSHLDRTPTGVRVPGIGLANYASLARMAVVVAGAVPTALTFLRNNFPRDDFPFPFGAANGTSATNASSAANATSHFGFLS